MYNGFCGDEWGDMATILRVTQSRVKIVGKLAHEWLQKLLHMVTNVWFHFLHACIFKIWCSLQQEVFEVIASFDGGIDASHTRVLWRHHEWLYYREYVTGVSDEWRITRGAHSSDGTRLCRVPSGECTAPSVAPFVTDVHDVFCFFHDCQNFTISPLNYRYFRLGRLAAAPPLCRRQDALLSTVHVRDVTTDSIG